MSDEIPIAKTAAGAPLLFGALGFSLHLESLVPEDAPRLVAACARMSEWIGPRLRFTWSSVHSEVSPFSPEDLELVSTYATELQYREDPSVAKLGLRAREGAAKIAAAKIDRFGVSCHGGAERNNAAPFGFRFYAIANPPLKEGIFTTRAMLSLTVPESWDLADFISRTTAIAALLRLRWGAAGFTYGAWEHDRYGDTRAAIYAHARRHPGYDIGQHASVMNAFHESARTASFLTFIGPALAKRVADSGSPLASDAHVAITHAGDSLVLRAGEKPERGDVNRRDVPIVYTHVDRKIRPVRASSGIHFLAPWSERTSEEWLARFDDQSGGRGR